MATTTSSPYVPVEVIKAASWWRRQLEQTGRVTTDVATQFEAILVNLLREKVNGHWFPELPWKGQGHRSLMFDRQTARPDPILQSAAQTATFQNLFDIFPVHLEQVIMWIDPGEVVSFTKWSYYQRGVEEVVYRAYSPTTPTKILSPPPQIRIPDYANYQNFQTPPSSPSLHYQYPSTPPVSRTTQNYYWSPKSPGTYILTA